MRCRIFDRNVVLSDPFFDNPPLNLLDSSPKNCDCSLDTDLYLSSSSSQDYIYDLEDCLQADMYAMTQIIPPSIPSTIPMNNPETIQTPSSLVDSSLVSYAVLLILHGLKSFLSFSGWLSMTLFIFVLILNMSGSVLSTYGSDLKSIHHSDFYTYQFSPVAHSFPSLALYPHGVTEAFVFVVPYANVSDISEFYHPHIISEKVLHHIGRSGKVWNTLS